ncbi:Xaa-Pro peptidase family protein [bacterium]|nr:Xaa-Pro peptidase family protein [bacterium]
MGQTEQHYFRNRQRALQHYIQKRRWDALWIVSGPNCRYLTGFTGSAGWVLVYPEGKPLLITDGRYTEQSRQECMHTTIRICNGDPHDGLADVIRKKRLQKLGFEDEHVTVKSWKKIGCLVKGLPASGCVEAARAFKAADERAAIQKAVTISEAAFQAILSRIKPGKSEIDIAMMLEKAMVMKGGEGLAFPTIIASGPNGALPHAKPSGRKIKSGELVVMDFGCVYKGYHADLTRTIAVKKTDKKQQKTYEIVKKAQILSSKYIISGEKSSESDKKARKIFRAEGMEKYYTHSLGHGLGLEIHEAPKLSIKSNIRLEENMVVTCEPGIYIPGWGGIRIEDDILVQKKDPIWLSRSSEKLQIV